MESYEQRPTIRNINPFGQLAEFAASFVQGKKPRSGSRTSRVSFVVDDFKPPNTPLSPMVTPRKSIISSNAGVVDLPDAEKTRPKRYQSFKVFEFKIGKREKQVKIAKHDPIIRQTGPRSLTRQLAFGQQINDEEEYMKTIKPYNQYLEGQKILMVMLILFIVLFGVIMIYFDTKTQHLERKLLQQWKLASNKTAGELERLS